MTSRVGECVVEYVVECVVGSGQDSLPQVIQKAPSNTAGS